LLAPVLAQLIEKYPNDVRVVFRHFPLSGHANSLSAAYAAEAATLQGKFPELSDAIFASQEAWGGLEPADAENWFVMKAGELGMDKDKLRADMKTDAVKKVVDDSLNVATTIGLPGTPFLFINGQPYQNNMDIDSLSSFVEFFKMGEKIYKSCPPMVIDTAKQYEATLKTEVGDIVVKLYPDVAPLTVNSFVFLARDGWFNNTSFHRVLENFVAQGGDPSGSGFGGPGYQFKNENATALFDREGLLAMANSGADTNGSQFFITFAPLANLNGGYTIFGEVLQGMDVAKKIQLRDPSTGAEMAPATKILSVEIREK
jgi:cyclophilin family peptidyl-prolyl cis-trans isomerase